MCFRLFSPQESLTLEEPFRSLWAGRDVFAEVSRLTGKTYRTMPGRRTLRFEMEGKGYFLKCHDGVGWREIFKNLLSGKLPVLGAETEWQALRALASAGLSAARVAGFGARGRNPARRQSFLITEEIAPAIDLETLTLSWKAAPPAARQKRALIFAVARYLRAMHRAGINHRDCYLCHFLWKTADSALPPEKTPGLALIDLHRAQIRAATPCRWRDKDLAALYFSARETGCTRQDHLRFLQTYFAPRPLREILRDETKTLRALEQKNARLMARYQKYGERL
ncbi:MAG: lipopolysaccharide core heptose(I) kinase RfaP [Zoogloeaceae bacterium]|jgi:heptose I phosphotransferase|nr:lipopolysaccharide core heptose(I) kinase RfaP [Zoogloeaceae bacterium]